MTRTRALFRISSSVGGAGSVFASMPRNSCLIQLIALSRPSPAVDNTHQASPSKGMRVGALDDPLLTCCPQRRQTPVARPALNRLQELDRLSRFVKLKQIPD